jgi:FKBP-type peptidyl-prolyl cis-trans isomerase SlyD
MENNNNKYIAVAYKLYAAGEKTLEFVEEATDEKPFEFISGFGFTLDEFEKQVVGLQKGDEFNFTLTVEQAYGKAEPERIVDLERDMFCINGHFDHEHVFVDALLPLQNEDGQRFLGKVLEIDEEKVKIDLNHPLADKELNFKGHIVENREATNEEIQSLINHISGGCGCDDCGDSCGDGCGHNHHEGCGCGHCH